MDAMAGADEFTTAGVSAARSVANGATAQASNPVATQNFLANIAGIFIQR
jgi:hypothetical protein